MWNDDGREWLHGDSLHTVEPEENNFDLIYKVIAEIKRDLKNGNDLWIRELLSNLVVDKNNNVLTEYLGEV